jgi:hypothetical protein
MDRDAPAAHRPNGIRSWHSIDKSIWHPHEIIRLGKLIGERGLAAVDNVELCPVYDPSGVTARLVWEVLSQMLYAHARARLGG